MRKRIATIIILATVGLVIGLPGATASEELRAHAIQCRHDRLYFDRGVEDRVLRHCRFVIMRESEPVYEGCIETSALGISYSYPTSGYTDSLDLDSITIILNPAPIDSLSAIVVGYCGPIDILTGGFNPTRAIYNELSFREYDSEFEMLLDFEAGRLDVIIGFREMRPAIACRTIAGTMAPFYVALVPNLSRLQKDRALITTSLYYRFDPTRMSLIFEGQAPLPYNCLTWYGRTRLEQACLRPYPYDPELGRLLLRQLRPKPRTLSLGATHPVFDAALHYYADILSRERIRITVESDLTEADIRLIPVPLMEGNATASLEYLQCLLSKETPPENDVSETLQIIGDYLRSARRTSDSTVADYYCNLAELSLRDDIGILPLYRPTVYAATTESITGWRSDNSGVICIEDLIKIILPRESCAP
ncbi:MAG: hypothetical protein KOO62_02060 [candidate division Zixibacteria bacterium]|nr:hypothetical protein [candidate division Zixibacteria bacterium]